MTASERLIGDAEIADMGGHVTGDVLVLLDPEPDGYRREYRLHDRQPQTRTLTRAGRRSRGALQWRPWEPSPMISPLSPVLRYLAERTTCAVCGEPVPYATIVTAVKTGTWARYCSPRCRETSKKRAHRAKRKRTDVTADPPSS